MKTLLLSGLMAFVLMSGHGAFAQCSGWGKFVPPKSQNFKQLQGIWMAEQESSGVFEIRPEGKRWVYVRYDFEAGNYEKMPLTAMKNGAFLKMDEGHYLGYDAQVKQIVALDGKGCRLTGSARLTANEIKIIHSPEGYTNVRRRASTKHAVTRKIPNGTKLIIAEHSEHNERPNNDWFEVMYFNDDKNLVGTGFVHKSQFK